MNKDNFYSPSLRNKDEAGLAVPQSPNIQAVFFDIDGTLVSFKTHSIPPSTKAAINQLRNKGIKVVIATGRSLSDIINLEGLTFDGFITANGAYCADSEGVVIAQNPISRESLDRLAIYMKEKPFSCSFMTDKGNFINHIDDLMLSLSKLVKVPLPPEKPVAEILKHTIYQLDAFIDAERETELLTHVLTDCIGCRWHPIFVDFNDQNCSKATGMDRMMDYFGLSAAHTMAFGDGGNDISMLQHATIGVAMGNAKVNVKAAADYVSTTVDDNGVANALKRFNLL
ncbi:MAG: Cof-type HAD-IIB family hydrolase [Tannerella sp.]|nr:Cof-type HAD-IIB family hydrolase [Tannerella sp.]